MLGELDMIAKHEELHETLSSFWDENVLEVPVKEDDDNEEIDIDEPLVQLDSITAVDVLIDIEKIVGKHLPIDQIVRKGGYSTKEQFIEEVTKAVDQCVGEAS
jgi:acyl carrier protein